MNYLDKSVSSSVRMFAFYLANGTLDCELIKEDYREEVFGNPSLLEMVFAIYLNVLEVDKAGQVTNSGKAKQRVAQYIKNYMDEDYIVEPPFQDWELELN